MKFQDMNTDEIYSIKDLYKDWKTFKEEDPENQCETFRAELLEIIMATINGRNDLQIIGMTGKEVSNSVIKLMKQING